MAWASLAVCIYSTIPRTDVKNFFIGLFCGFGENWYWQGPGNKPSAVPVDFMVASLVFPGKPWSNAFVSAYLLCMIVLQGEVR